MKVNGKDYLYDYSKAKKELYILENGKKIKTLKDVGHIQCAKVFIKWVEDNKAKKKIANPRTKQVRK